jgi:hypothetical protein
MTLLPPGAGALLLLLALVLGLLLEQPAKPAITVAAAAMPTKIPCFATGLLCLVADFDTCALKEIDAVSSGMHGQGLVPFATLRVRLLWMQ